MTKRIALFLALTLLVPVNLAFAGPGGETEVDVVVKGSTENSTVIAGAEVFMYIWDAENDTFTPYGESGITNSSGRANNMLVPIGSTFYAIAYDESSEVYASSGSASFPNRWYAEDESTIQNTVIDSTRSPAYIHVYPGEDLVAMEPEVVEEPVVSTDGGVPGEGVELEVTVYNDNRDPIAGAQVWIYLDQPAGAVYSGPITTDGAGRTDGLMVPVGSQFYAIATDGEGQSYGGKYDYYFNRGNIWVTSDGETMENTDTGLNRILYLHLYPEEMNPAPTGYTGDPAAFDPDTYTCGGFPDAPYIDVTPELCEAIDYVKREGIFTGTGEGLLDLYRPINRAEVTKVMIEAFNIGILEDFTTVSRFPDVPAGQWYSQYVYIARQNNIVGGYPDGYFRPADTINRVELLRIFTEASGEDYSAIPTTFTFWHDIIVDVPPQWFMGYANLAFYNDWLENDGNLYPAQPMTRMDVIRLMYRAGLTS